MSTDGLVGGVIGRPVDREARETLWLLLDDVGEWRKETGLFHPPQHWCASEERRGGICQTCEIWLDANRLALEPETIPNDATPTEQQP